MTFKVWLKSKVADRALAPLRQEMAELIENDASVIDIGCGTGDFLLLVAPTISKGYGIDLDSNMIQHAQNMAKQNSYSHIKFDCLNAIATYGVEFDIAFSTLCVHELRFEEACQLLKTMAEHSTKIVIADYAQPRSLLAKFLIEIDEIVSGHYQRFRDYRSAKGIPTYAKRCNLRITRTIPSRIDGIVIWELQSA
ncbi:class I SAM-dependent methyltransferase [Gilvimarinus sp. SDUM040013]|uniref:Class I SAM-dependent methyltransferase n=1 Tax=Gilvimarinus gilvus TaxID=3058038 RepID=A0ABU4RZJ9_9GAMM|nr:class I SAM-dependent methyltransferase [Gilvimarinus sp. SDUM040013]MDO3384634.1 class I SAM-dependent methyltransferase [Gilvimarinus sp. SDUM040013]MDX6850220.1 class I SAM-dependent methyltransferase [Gilvimarinus sp. SDUM040013]